MCRFDVSVFAIVIGAFAAAIGAGAVIGHWNPDVLVRFVCPLHIAPSKSTRQLVGHAGMFQSHHKRIGSHARHKIRVVNVTMLLDNLDQCATDIEECIRVAKETRAERHTNEEAVRALYRKAQIEAEKYRSTAIVFGILLVIGACATIAFSHAIVSSDAARDLLVKEMSASCGITCSSDDVVAVAENRMASLRELRNKSDNESLRRIAFRVSRPTNSRGVYFADSTTVDIFCDANFAILDAMSAIYACVRDMANDRKIMLDMHAAKSPRASRLGNKLVGSKSKVVITSK
jgi:hypothetical protein